MIIIISLKTCSHSSRVFLQYEFFFLHERLNSEGILQLKKNIKLIFLKNIFRYFLWDDIKKYNFNLFLIKKYY
jgi:hypothetical protein